MFGEHDSSLVPSIQSVSYVPADVQFLLEPEWHRLLKRSEGCWCIGQLRLEQVFEFQQRFVVETDEIDVLWRYAGFLEAVVNGMRGKSLVVLLSGEPFLLGGRNNAAVDHKSRGESW